MENRIEIRDTIYNYTLDSECILGPSCKLHTHKTIKEIIMHPVDPYYYSAEVDGYFMRFYVNESGDTLLIDSEYIGEQVNLTSEGFSAKELGIEPCNSEYLIRGDLRSAKEIIGILPSKSEIMKHNDFNDEITGTLFAVMLLLTAIYILNSYRMWIKMVAEIRFALK